MRKDVLCGAALAAALLLAACGSKKPADTAAADAGTPAAATAAADFDPCSVLTADEVAAITTDKVNSVERQEKVCYYHSNPDDGISLTVDPTGGAKQMEVVHNAARLLGGMGAAVADKGAAGADAAQMMKGDRSAAPKLGDEAVWGMNSTLSVRAGQAFVEVTPPIMHDPASHSGYPLVGGDEKRAIAEKVAAAVIAKLPR